MAFAHQLDVYVAADMFLYYEQSNPRTVKAPDIMIIKGVAHPEERRSFKLWVENRAPGAIFEVTSKKSRKDDSVVKMELYARLGVPEYFLFDPLGEYLEPRFQAYRLNGGRYEPIAPEANGDILSRELDLGIRVVGTRLRLIDLVDGRVIPDDFIDRQGAERYILELAIRRQLDEERKARAALEKAAKRGARKLEIEKRKAEAERQKAEALQAEVFRLRALLGEKGEANH